MKKFISMCLAMCMLFTLFSVCAYADDPSDSMSKQDLFKLAAQVFPEHAAEINRSLCNGVTAYSMADDEIVESETRRISKNETMELAIFKSGAVVVAYGCTDFSIQPSGVSTSQVGSDIIGRTTFIISFSYATRSIKLSNIGFIIHQNGNGYFTSYGTNDALKDVTVVVESETSSTYLERSLIFYVSNKPKQVTFKCRIYDGQVVAELSY